MMWEVGVPGRMIQGALGAIGVSERPVDAAVA
jgi:hypothetical protein